MAGAGPGRLPRGPPQSALGRPRAVVLEAAVVPTSKRVDSRSSFPAGPSRGQLSRWVSWRGQAVAQEARGQGVQLGLAHTPPWQLCLPFPGWLRSGELGQCGVTYTGTPCPLRANPENAGVGVGAGDPTL